MKTTMASTIITIIITVIITMTPLTLVLAQDHEPAGGGSRFLQQNTDDNTDKFVFQFPPWIRGCNNNNNVCSRYGASGSCCNNRCVNIQYHPNHCGSCNNRCYFGQVCCSGQCVNLLADPNNCGWCNRRCPNCFLGLCDYA